MPKTPKRSKPAANERKRAVKRRRKPGKPGGLPGAAAPSLRAEAPPSGDLAPLGSRKPKCPVAVTVAAALVTTQKVDPRTCALFKRVLEATLVAKSSRSAAQFGVE